MRQLRLTGGRGPMAACRAIARALIMATREPAAPGRMSGENYELADVPEAAKPIKRPPDARRGGGAAEAGGAEWQPVGVATKMMGHFICQAGGASLKVAPKRTGRHLPAAHHWRAPASCEQWANYSQRPRPWALVDARCRCCLIRLRAATAAAVVVNILRPQAPMFERRRAKGALV